MTIPITLTVARIGNSRGVRIPAATLRRYLIGDAVIMEEREEGILLRPMSANDRRLSWAETARAMAEAREDWSDWDAVSADGLDQLAWDAAPGKPKRAAEHSPTYTVGKRSKAPASKVSAKPGTR